MQSAIKSQKIIRIRDLSGVQAEHRHARIEAGTHAHEVIHISPVQLFFKARPAAKPVLAGPYVFPERSVSIIPRAALFSVAVWSQSNGLLGLVRSKRRDTNTGGSRG